MKVNFYENNGDMLLMVVRNNNGVIEFAHDYDGNYDRAEEDAAIAADAQDGDLVAWDGNILEDEDEMERYGMTNYTDAATAFDEMIDENEGRNTGNGICERKDMKLFRVNEDYVDKWFGDRAPVAITAREIWRLADEWEVDVADLMKQVTELR